MVRRVPLAAAVAFAVLSVFAVVVVPLGPGIERPGADVVEHVTAHAGDDPSAGLADRSGDAGRRRDPRLHP